MFEEFTGNKNTDNPILVFSKGIKEKQMHSDKITQKTLKDKILEIISSLLQLGKQEDLDDLQMAENCRDWISSLLDTFPEINQDYMKYLLNDFTDSMKTRMREEEKYVISVLYDKGLLLAHSIYGEETITPAWEVVKRMMDKDNVIRFVHFRQENKSIKVTYYELYPSDSFVDWLGLPQKEAFYYFGGKNRIYTEIIGIPCALEFTDEEIEEKILKEIIKVEGKQLSLPNPLQKLKVTQIRVGKKRYKNIDDFLQDFLAKRYELSYYQNKYNEIASSLLPITNKLIDETDYLIMIEKEEEKVLVRKRNPHFHIIFANKEIEIRKSFLDDIVTKLLNKEQIKVFHAGMKLSPNPLKILSMEIFNQLNCSNLTRNIIDYFHGTDIRDNQIEKILYCTIFDLLRRENKKKPISYFFERISDKLCKEIDVSRRFTTHEDEIIEFKSRDFFVGNNRNLIEKVVEDLEKKLSTSPFKVYIIGVNEETYRIEPIPLSRAKSDRLNGMEKALESKLRQNVHFLKIPLKDGENCVLLLIAGVKNGNAKSRE